jgi:hypothetical protein
VVKTLSGGTLTTGEREIEPAEAAVISDELWAAAKDRQKATRHVIVNTGNIGHARRPQYLFSGLTKCGVCGAGFIMASQNRLACLGARDKETCTNHLTIRRDEVEARVLEALEEKLLRQDLFVEFCEEFAREMNRLGGEHRASLVAAERELVRLVVRRKKLVESIMEGVSGSQVKDELIAIAGGSVGRQRERENAGVSDGGARCSTTLAGVTIPAIAMTTRAISAVAVAAVQTHALGRSASGLPALADAGAQIIRALEGDLAAAASWDLGRCSLLAPDRPLW